MYSAAQINGRAFMEIHSVATSDFPHYVVPGEYYELHFKGLIWA